VRRSAGRANAAAPEMGGESGGASEGSGESGLRGAASAVAERARTGVTAGVGLVSTGFEAIRDRIPGRA
jgi:hypothetical protein